MLRPRGEPDFYKTLIRLALPLILQNLINNTLSLADTFMVGGLGEQELAAVTLGNNVFFAVMLISFGIQSGSSILISQYWGRGDVNTINRVMGLGLMISGVFMGTFCAFVMLFPRFVMSLMTPDAALIELGIGYITIVAPAYLLNSLSMVYCSAQRSMENARIGLVVLLMSTIVNTSLNYVLIYGKLGFPMLGVKGAAVATVIARVVEFAVVVGYALRNTRFILNFKYLFKPGKVIFRDYVKYAMPVIVNEGLWGFGFMLYPIIVGNMPNAAITVTAYSIAMSIDRIMAALFFGTGTATAVLLGKRLGQGESGDEVYSYAKSLLIITGLVGLFAGVFLVISSTFVVKPFLFPLFNNMSPETMELAWLLLLISAGNMTFRSINFTVIVGILRGGGDVKAAAALDVLFMYCVGLPLAYIFALKLGVGVMMVTGAVLIEEFVKSFASVWRFRTRRWINNVTKDIA